MKQANTQEIITPDAALYRGLTRMQRAFDGLLSTRAVSMPLPSKMPLAVEMSNKLAPVLADVYWFPVRNGISEAPQDEGALMVWLKRQLVNTVVWTALVALMLLFHKRAVNQGGTIALDILGLTGQFNLTNSDYLSLLDERTTMLTTADSEMNLIDTTVNDLSIAIPAARNATGDTLALLGAYIAGRALTRSAGIATFEVPWGFNNGLEWTYGRNGVRYMMYDVNGIGCEEFCAPLHGRITEVGNRDGDLFIPQHPGCDCCWTILDDGYQPPEQVWTGE
jgi:hypothetical protein